jgi:hypothetical protein
MVAEEAVLTAARQTSRSITLLFPALVEGRDFLLDKTRKLSRKALSVLNRVRSIAVSPFGLGALIYTKHLLGKSLY